MPTYETSRDRENQRRIALMYADRRGWELIMLPQFSAVDCIFYDALGFAVEIAEIKCQERYRFGAFAGGYKCPGEKLAKMRTVSQQLRLPCNLVVEFSDALAWMDVHQVPVRRDQSLSVPDRGLVYDAELFAWEQWTTLDLAKA